MKLGGDHQGEVLVRVDLELTPGLAAVVASV